MTSPWYPSMPAVVSFAHGSTGDVSIRDVAAGNIYNTTIVYSLSLPALIFVGLLWLIAALRR